MNKITHLFLAAAIAASCMPVMASASDDSILTDKVVELNEITTDNGFVHPGIGFSADSLKTMREMVIDGVSPWVDYFEGMRRTRYADLDGELKKTEKITNNTGISNFADDAQRSWVQAMLYFVTGNEEYRRIPVEAIKFYSEREDFFPSYFSDSHIKLGKYVRTFCEMAELMRYTDPEDESLAVTDEMIKKLDENCLKPLSDKTLSTKTYFMNQHNYAVQGYLAETVLANDSERYADAVEMTTVNKDNTSNPPRNGSIANMVREVSYDEETGEACEPHVQIAEMGRDQDHAKGNIDNFVLMARTTDAQKTKVDPVTGQITDAENGISVTNFGNDAIIKGAEVFFEYNMGYDIPWTTIYSENNGETDRKMKVAFYRAPSTGYRGRLQSTGTVALYYRYKGMGYDLEKDYPMVYEAGQKVIASTKDFVYTGTYIDTIHNYDFDFWTDLDASAAEGEPDKAKAKAALAKDLAPYTTTAAGTIEIEDRFIDLNVNGEAAQRSYPTNASDKPIEQLTDPDGTEYARVHMTGDDARTMVVYNADMPKNKLGLLVRTDGKAELKLYNNSDYSNGEMLTVAVPDTKNEWKYVTFDFSEGSVKESDRGAIWYLTAKSEGAEHVDLDKINTSEASFVPLKISTSKAVDVIAACVGENIEKEYAADGEAKYSADGLPEGAVIDSATGKFSWTPEKSGDYEFIITADNTSSVYSKKVVVKVRDNKDDQLDVITESYSDDVVYTKRSADVFNAALSKAKEDGSKESFDKLQEAVDSLEVLNPQLKYGGLDYAGLVTCSAGAAVENLVDDKPVTNISKNEPDMNITLDFGSEFKLRAYSFEIQPTDGFPARCLESAVYGSDDGVNWVQLTENRAVINDRMQTLDVTADEKANAYRYIRIYMPNGTNNINENAYIMGVGEFRINGERIEASTPDYHRSYFEGYEDGTFRPENNTSRAEAAIILSRTVKDYMDNKQCSNPFGDVAADAWYERDLAYMAKRKFITADQDKNFRPEESVTRGEFCEFVAALKGLKGDATTSFSDVSGTTYENKIALIEKQGWIDGYEDGTFRPDAHITRAEMAAIMCRMDDRDDAHGENVYSDVSDDHWAINYITELTTGHFVD